MNSSQSHMLGIIVFVLELFLSPLEKVEFGKAKVCVLDRIGNGEINQ